MIVVTILLSGVYDDNEWDCSRSSLMICKKRNSRPSYSAGCTAGQRGRSDIRMQEILSVR
jgi:hypothetical protein